MSSATKITDEEMRFFQFKARQLYLLRREDHEWNEFCKRNTCSCCSCQTNLISIANKEVDIQPSPRKNLNTTVRNTGNMLHSNNKNLPQTLNEIKTKLEKIDIALSEMKVPVKSDMKAVTKPKEIFDQQLKVQTLPLESEMAESVRSVINERRMQLIQDSLKKSVQRLQSAALRNAMPDSHVKAKKKSSGYFIPRELERQRAAARRAYLASLKKTTVEPKISLRPTQRRVEPKQDNSKLKSIKAGPKSNLKKLQKIDSQKEEETLASETKDENIETAIDKIIDDILGETVLVLNKIKQSKSEKSLAAQNIENVPYNTSPIKSSQEAETAVKIRGNLLWPSKETDPKFGGETELVENENIVKRTKDAAESTQVIDHNAIPSKYIGETRTTQPLRDLSIDPIKAQPISKCRTDYWNYLERISRTKKGNFDPWTLSNLVAESLLDDCIHEIAEELQDVPTTLVADLYDQEFLQSI